VISIPPFLLPNSSKHSVMHFPPLAKKLTEAGDILEDDCFYLINESYTSMNSYFSAWEKSVEEGSFAGLSVACDNCS
jgi:hypothetical protein